MATYRITSSAGVDMGTYQGATEADALDAMARAAGYDSQADADARGIAPFAGEVEALHGENQATTLTDLITEQWANLSERAQRRIRATRPALLTQWELLEEGHHWDTVTAASRREAIRAAKRGVDRDNYGGDDGRTLYVDVSVRNVVTGEEEVATVALQPEAPDCEEGHQHDWQSPYEVVGGIKSNPGVWGHGGGVIMRAVCAHCGVYRVTDTWAQRPDTGEQGLTEVSYEDADETSLPWVAGRKLRAVRAALRTAGYDADLRDDHLVVLDAAAECDDADALVADVDSVAQQHGATAEWRETDIHVSLT